MRPLEPLFETGGLPAYDLPDRLHELYGGRLGFEEPWLYANFVSSLDGVVAIDQAGIASGSAISGHHEGDRFIMGLLRACADAVLVGAGTVRAERAHHWTPGYIFPAAAPEFAELRRRLGRSSEPRLAVLTARGDLDASLPALRDGALVLTTEAAAPRLRRTLPATAAVMALGDASRLDLRQAIGMLHAEGHRVVLSEGGPTVLGELMAGGLLDEIFLTFSPVFAGRGGDSRRRGLLEGVELLPGHPVWASLRSLRRSESHLFARYGVRKAQPAQRP